MSKGTADKAKKMRILGICAIAAAVLLIGGGVYLLMDDDESETVTPSEFAEVGQEDTATACQNIMSQYYADIMGDNAEGLYKLMAPPEYWQYYMETYGKTESDVISTYADAINNTKSQWQASCGSDAKVSFQIKASGEQSDEFLKEWSDTMNEVIGSDVLVAEEAITLNVEQTVTGSSGTEESINTPTLIKVNGSWYILDEGISS